MDKKTLTGLLLIGVIILGFTWYNSNQIQKNNREQAIADSIYNAQNPQPADTQTRQDMALSPAQADDTFSEPAEDARTNRFGAMLTGQTGGSETFHTVENNLARYTFSNKGGRIAAVELKDYKTYDGRPLMLFESATSRFDLDFFIRNEYNNIELATGDLYFTMGESTGTEDYTTVSMRLHITPESYLEYLYTIPRDNYMVDMSVRFVNMAQHLSNQSDFIVSWSNTAPQSEKGFKNENNYTTISYMFPGEKSAEKLAMSDGARSRDVNSKIRWVAFKQQFFSSVIIARGDFINGSMRYDTEAEGSGNIKEFQARLAVEMNPGATSYDFSFYFGPNKYSVLNKYDLGLQDLIPLGGWIIRWINVWVVIPLFDLLGKHIHSYGVIILILTILLKLVTSPLTYKSYLSTAKMRLLKPEVDAINAKYPKQEDNMKKQQAIMDLYKSAGASPMGGCIPMLIQFPILIAFFRFFPASIELRGESFLWADDLSAYDSILELPFMIPFYGSHISLFALLMAVSTYISSRISYNQTAASAPNMAGMKFMSLYMMPLMLLMWLNNFSSGLSYYYLLANIITIGTTYLFRYSVNDDKLHRRMKENAAKTKTKKKSGWAARYEQMLKAQQEQQRQLQQKKKKK